MVTMFYPLLCHLKKCGGCEKSLLIICDIVTFDKKELQTDSALKCPIPSTGDCELPFELEIREKVEQARVPQNL